VFSPFPTIRFRMDEVQNMVKGRLDLYAAREVKGDIIYDAITPQTRLGGLGNPIRASYRFETPLEEGSELIEALLEVALTTKEPMLRYWRLWFDGVAITREYRPQLYVKLEEEYFSKIVYNLTPIFKISKREHYVTINYEGGAEITVDHIGLLVSYKNTLVNRQYLLLSGSLALEPGETYQFKLPNPITLNGMVTARVYAITPSRYATLSLRVPKVVSTEVRNKIGGVEIYIQRALRIPTKVDLIELAHGPSNIQYYPKYIKISSVILESGDLVEPIVDVVKITNKQHNELDIELENRGIATATNVIVLSISKGIVLDRVIIPQLKPKDTRHVTLKFKDDGIIRVVWRFKGKSYFRDLKPR